MSTNIVIKATKRYDMWDYKNKKPIEDTIPIGFVMEIDGQIPESFIKYVPGKIFDRRKYPELYEMFGKDHLPTQNELYCYVNKHKEEWYSEKTLEKSLTTILINLIIMVSIMVGIIAFIAMH